MPYFLQIQTAYWKNYYLFIFSVLYVHFLILYAHFFLNPLCFIYQSILFHPLVNQYILFPMHTYPSKIFNSENQVILTLLLHQKIKTASFKKFHLLPWFFGSRMEFFDSLYLLRHSFYFFKMLVVPCTPIFLTSVCQRSIIVFSSSLLFKWLALIRCGTIHIRTWSAICIFSFYCTPLNIYV